MEATIGSIWETQTKAAKIDYFIKNLSSHMVFEITTSKVQEVFKKILWKNYNKNLYKKKTKKQFLFFFVIKILFEVLFKILFRQNFQSIAMNISWIFEVVISKNVGEDRFTVISSYLPF